MKKLTLLLTVVLTSIIMAVPAQAKFRIGPRVGVDVSSLHFNKDIFDKENRVGFTAGLQMEITMPLGFAVDASVMYARRSIEGTFDNGYSQTIKANRDYINVPLNIKWNLGLPLVGKFLSPYIFTGPDFAFLASKSGINDAWKSRKVDVAWNVGVGLQLISHLQVSASYGIGMTKLGHSLGMTNNTHSEIQGKNNNWTITAAWLF